MIDGPVLVLGASGMLGSELVRAAARRGLDVRAASGRNECDVTDRAAANRFVERVRPAVVFNATGFTDVDGAEADVRGAFAVNAEAPGHLASACRDVGALFVHYSTDYVFGGAATAPIPVDAIPAPINVYGLSKLAGERAVTRSGAAHVILRTSWLYAAHGKNFFRTIERISRERDAIDVVTDQVGRPTYAPDLAAMSFALIEARARGTFHAANGESCSWHGFASEIVRAAGRACEVRPCTTERFPRPAKRPAYSVLDLSMAVRITGEPRSWREAVRACLHETARLEAAATRAEAPA